MFRLSFLRFVCVNLRVPLVLKLEFYPRHFCASQRTRNCNYVAANFAFYSALSILQSSQMCRFRVCSASARTVSVHHSHTCLKCYFVPVLTHIISLSISDTGSIYRRGARRWRKFYKMNGHTFHAKRFNRVCMCLCLQDKYSL